jgi:hypothetical protein
LLIKFHEIKGIHMFKKTLIALTVVGMSSTAWGAATLSSTAVAAAGVTLATPSIQQVTTQDAYVVTGPILHLDANYATGDTITVTYSGAALDEDYTHPTTNLTIGTTQGTIGCTAGNQAVSFAGLQGNVATFTIGASDGATSDCTVALPDVNVDGASLATADTFSFAVSTSRGFGVLESVATTQAVNVGAAEITVTVTKLNGVIDVNDARNTLTDGAATPAVETTDVGTYLLADANVTATDTAGGAVLGATSTMTLTGDFSWAASTDAQGAVTYPAVGITAAGGAGNIGTVTKTATSVTWVAKAADTYTATLTPPVGAAKVSLPKTDYAFSASLAYTNGLTAAVVTDAVTDDGGAWTLNGASITAYGIPNSTAVTPFLWVQNAGTSTGDISVDVTCDGASIAAIAAGTAAAAANTSIGAVVQAGVDAAGTCPAGSRYDAAITINGPAADMTVTAGYKVTAADGSSDRLGLETSDSLN